MLVLTRKLGEKIQIGGGITVSVVEIRGSKIRLGIDAPDDVPIVRSELHDFVGRSDTGAVGPASLEAAHP